MGTRVEPGILEGLLIEALPDIDCPIMDCDIVD
jgi:hypothetical protein